MAENLSNYFKIIIENYKEFSLGLSGGFDSRLILSLLLKYDTKPFIYTNGNPNSIDVKISKGICKAFGLEFVNYYENDEFFKGSNLAEVIDEKFILDDGFNNFGAFFSIQNKDLINSQKARTNLNGAGGEIYRAWLNLSNKDLGISDFMNVKLNDFSENIPRESFNRSIFFESLRKKIINNFGIEFSGVKIPPPFGNLIYPEFRLRYWAGRTISKINQFCFALLPYTEPILYLQSIYIPFKYKVAGKFEAALIKKINPELAKHDSNYGFNFFDGPDFKKTLIEHSKIYIPNSLRLLLRRKDNKKRFIMEFDNINQKRNLIFENKLQIGEYLNLDKIISNDMYSRALTVEYYIRNYM